MTSSIISRTSAVALAFGGVSLLFLSDTILPMLSPGFPPSSAWIGQLLGAAWLGVAALNWTNGLAPLGGIYGRPVVITNMSVYFIGGVSVLKAAQHANFPLALSILSVLMLIFAAVYGWLLFRGPLSKDLASHQ